ncbi:MAG: glycerol kinase [Desulfobacteraceae bacterium]|nr:glycerol kinase [Desulfobacteraceae bacterium]
MKSGDNWELTEQGRNRGGTYREHHKFGKYIAWPENIDIKDHENDNKPDKPGSETATEIGKKYNLPATRINSILSELGWISKGIKGWVVTDQGLRKGGVQKENMKSGVPYVIWPVTIHQDKSFLSTVKDVMGSKSEDSQQKKDETGKGAGFREKFEAKHRATDGHYVRSKAEMLIDNWLYMAEIVHAYERRLPIEEEVYSDFYIPTGKVDIEYWGYDNDAKYNERKKKKQKIYAKYGFRLIELVDKDVQNLDDILPKLLLKHGIQSY